MSLLGHNELLAALAEPDLPKRLVVMPMLDLQKQVGPASIDVRLGTQFRVLRRTHDPNIDPGSASQASLETHQQVVTVGFGSPLWLHPGQFVLGATLEFLRFPAHLGAYVIGRSSWGRAGLLVATAVMVQPGFGGALTLELVNHGESPIALYAGTRVAQLAVHSLPSATSDPYKGGYATPSGPQVARLARERAEIDHMRDVARQLAGG